MRQLKVGLPDELRAQVEAAAGEAGRTLSDEIRIRLESTFARDQLDKPTRELLDGIALMAGEVERETGAPWYKHLGAYGVFKEAILKRLVRSEPEGLAAFGKRPHQTVPADDAAGLAAWIEEHLHDDPGFTSSRLRQELERSFRQMERSFRHMSGLNRKDKGERK